MSRRVAARAFAALAATLIALALVLLGAPAASAHAVLVRSTPADGARLRVAPAAVVLVFDEAVALPPGATAVLSDAGARVGGTARLTGGGTVRIPLKRGLPRGVYTVSWRVVSADTHVVTGSIRFGVGRAVSATAGGARAAWSALDIVQVVGSGGVNAGLVLAVGAPAVALLLWPSLRGSPRLRRIRRGGALLVVAGTLAVLLVQGPNATGSGWPGVLRFDDVAGTLAGPLGIAGVARLVALACWMGVLGLGGAGAGATAGPLGVDRLGSRPWRLVGLALSALILAGSVAVSGHAVVGTPWITVPAATLHVAGMLVWLGGLILIVVVLIPRLRGATRVPGRLFRSWSRLAFVAVAAIVVSGEVQALQTVQPVQALWQTGYGRLLIAKLALLLIAVSAAALATRAARRRAVPVRALRRAVGVESAVLVAVLAVTAVFTASPTAKETFGPPVVVRADTGSGQVAVHVSSTRRGATEIRLDPREDSGRRVALGAVSGVLSTAGVAGLSVRFAEQANGEWVSRDAVLPVPGRWTLTLQVTGTGATGTATSATWTVW